MLRREESINKGVETMRNIQSKAIKLVAEALGCTEDSLNLDSRLGHHEKWDSLGQISIVATIESKYNIEIDENNIDKLFSISDICHFVDDLEQ